MNHWTVETADPPARSGELTDRLLAVEVEGPAEVQDQLAAAKSAAIDLIASGAIGATGTDGEYFAATFAGVANPGNQTEEGPTDRITVEVRQVQYEPPAPPEPEAAEAEAPAEKAEPVPA